ncbi:hypothetical protein [Zhihengliuella sp.]|uniref:hypothetical protein n=1 Tax=Zhihengliuella sp. TaxID=1954483 RepID=UPI002811B1AB|nr:hypothetical protein [Zhihengliuella sp.]
MTTAPAATAALLVGGAALCLAGFVLTVVYHVPRNESLARLDPGAAGLGCWVAVVGGRGIRSLAGE